MSDIEEQTLNAMDKALNKKDAIRPDHYGGTDNPYEHYKVVEAWGLGYHLGNATKYICRAGKKDPEKELEDLEKAAQYVAFRIAQVKRERGPNGG